MKKYLSILALIIIPVISIVHAQCPCMSKGKFISEQGNNDYHPVRLFSDGFFTEGATMDSEGNIYFSDLTFTDATNNTAGIIYKYIASEDTTVIYRSPSGMANGLYIYNDTLFVCEGADKGGRRITKTDLKTGRSWIVADSYKGKKLNSPNDLIVTNNGTIYFTDPRYVGDEVIEQDYKGVYRINSDNSIDLLIDNISQPNGIAISADKEYLFVGCFDESVDTNVITTEKMAGSFVARYKFSDNGKPLFDKVIAEFGNGSGPDGIAVDDDNKLYIAVRNESLPSLRIIDIEGNLLKDILLPEVPSNVTVVNHDVVNELYVTTGSSLYEIVMER